MTNFVKILLYVTFMLTWRGNDLIRSKSLSFAEASSTIECGTVAPYNDTFPFFVNHPWNAAIHGEPDKSPHIYICGGQLLTTEYVVTVASCVSHWELWRLNVYLGNKYSNDFSIHQPSDMVIHPDYNEDDKSNNVALLRLKEPIVYNKYVRPICLWQDEHDISKYEGKIGLVTGRSLGGDRSKLKVLNDMEVVIKSPFSCFKTNNTQFFLKYLNEKTICGYNETVKELCLEYEGGGLLFPKAKNSNVWQLRGIASFGYFDKGTQLDRCIPNYVVFIDLVKYLDWIKTTITQRGNSVNSKELFSRNRIAVINKQCGIVPTKGQSYIRHGLTTSSGDWPWHAAIYITDDNNEKVYACGGSLISNNHVLTAAHCLVSLGTTDLRNVGEYLLYFGVNNLDNLTSTLQTRKVSKMFIHSEYEYPRFYNDVGLIKLEKSVELNEYVIPVCLWEDDLEISHLDGKLGTLVGWGNDETNEISKQLLKANLPIVSLFQCLESDRLFFATFLYEKNYCAGYRNGTSACSGDSGGGMVFEISDKPGTWQIRGIVSVGAVEPVNKTCHPSHYIIFTDVAKHLDWIKDTMDAN